MEDISGNIQRELARIHSTPPPKHKRGWTVLLVGDNGEVITIRRFKRWVVFYAMLLIAAVTTASALWFMSRNPIEKNHRLTREIAALREQLTSVKAEKDLMMARMVVSAARSHDAVAGPVAPSQSPATANPPKAARVPEGIQQKATERQTVSAEKAAQAIAPDTEAEKTAAVISPPVDVEDLQVTKDDDNQILHARFMLKKVDSSEGSVTGRTFVLLKKKNAMAPRWLSMPAVPLKEGRPSRIRNGRYFAISRFNVVKFSTPYDAPAGAFNKATILVYSLQGQLLLEKSFDVKVSVGHPPDQDIGE